MQYFRFNLGRIGYRIAILIGLWAMASPANAQSGDQPLSNTQPEINKWQPLTAINLDDQQTPLNRNVPEEFVITADTFSAVNPTIPSLWWQQDQIIHRVRSQAPSSRGQLIETWAAYSSPDRHRYIDVVVVQSIWRQLSYIDQYSILEKLGTEAEYYGYQLRLFSSNQLEASYLCMFANQSLYKETPHTPLPSLPSPLSETTPQSEPPAQPNGQACRTFLPG